MMRRPLNTVIQQLRTANEQDGARSTDGELLTRFLSQRDNDALASLVERHASMVWGVCHRVLRNPHDAEDAFQSTFLVLVRKAGTVAPREMVANWLYGVAHQTAVRLRATAAKRGLREMQPKEMPEPAAAEIRVSDLLTLLDQELSRLPEHHRALIVLCDLEGLTRKEAARQLGCPEGTVASRLARARDMLAQRMARQGLAVTGGTLTAVVAQSTSAAGVPNTVVASAIDVATRFAANPALEMISGPVAALTQRVLKTMLLKKIMTTTMVVLAIGVATITGGSLAVGQTGGKAKPPMPTEKPMENEATPEASKTPEKPKGNYVVVVGQLLDDATGKPIEKAGWEHGMADPKKPTEIAWGHGRSLGNTHPEGKFDQVVNLWQDGGYERLRVYAAGYETAVVVDDLPSPRPQRIERIVRMKRGRTVTGVLRDHVGKPVANGLVFFIPKSGRSNIVEGITGADSHALPKESRDHAVSQVRTNADGTFSLPVTKGGTLAASTELVDLWPFPLPENGPVDLKMPAPAYLVIDLKYSYLDELVKKGKRELSPDNEDPNQCWLAVDREWTREQPWGSVEYRRQMLVFSKDLRAKLSKGVVVGQVVEGKMPQPIPDVGHNKSVSTKIRVALPPGSYRVQRLRAGPFAPVDERNIVLKAGEDTNVSWARGDGSSVRGKATWPANRMFVRQPGEAPRKLDWSVPDYAMVRIAPTGGDGKPIESAKVQRDGSFFIATNLEPGKYKASVAVYMPEGDFRGGLRMADCTYSTEFTVPEPARGPSGSPPVEVEIMLDVGTAGRFVPAKVPDSPKAGPAGVPAPAAVPNDPLARFGDKLVASWAHHSDTRRGGGRGFRVYVLTDGTVVAGGDGNRNRECQIKLTPKQLKQLLSQLDVQGHCFDLKPDGEHFIAPGTPYNMWERSADWVYVRHGAKLVHIGCIYGWPSDSEDRVPGVAIFNAVMGHLRSLINWTRAGGLEELERMLPVANAAMKQAFPDAPALRTEDFTSSERFLYPARSITFVRQVEANKFGVWLERRDDGKVLPVSAWKNDEKRDLDKAPTVRGLDLSKVPFTTQWKEIEKLRVLGPDGYSYNPDYPSCEIAPEVWLCYLLKEGKFFIEHSNNQRRRLYGPIVGDPRTMLTPTPDLPKSAPAK